MDPSLKLLVQQWLDYDKNEQTLNEVTELLDRNDVYELERRMRPRITFGTAGLRAEMSSGWARMNDLIIIQTSQGLASYAIDNITDAREKGVVIGHDHRHQSQVQHLEMGSSYSYSVPAQRFQSLPAPKTCTHPSVRGSLVQNNQQSSGSIVGYRVPFSISKVSAACGVMITASHNPKNDNGYKVYWENAVQIISPHDLGISKAIESNLEPLSWETQAVLTDPQCLDITDEVISSYFKYLTSLRIYHRTKPDALQTIKFVNTSLHGVSNEYALRAFQSLELPPYYPVVEQQEPDPEFPSVKFPNPEEKGALDLAIVKANECGALYILAQDPDADRFSAAQKRPNGEWHIFSGDELGSIFAKRRLEDYVATGQPLNKLAMVASTVSSRLLGTMAMKEGFKFEECLTGFKYIGNVASRLTKEGYEVLFGYEEAIGFMIGSGIRDKDGIMATAYFAQLALSLSDKSLTIFDYLEEIWRKYGVFRTANTYFVCQDKHTIDNIFKRLRAFHGIVHPYKQDYPNSIAGLHVKAIRDLTTGYDSSNPPSYKALLPLSSGHMIQIRAGTSNDDVNISLTIRTSGTEPKIKVYLEGNGRDLKEVETILPLVQAELRDSWLEAEKNNLQLP